MDTIIETLLDLIKIPSVSGQKKEIKKVLEYVKKHFKAPYVHQFDFEGASPILLLSNGAENDFDVLTVGHLDVVPAAKDLFKPRIYDGFLYARGALDMKAAICVNLYTLKYAIENSLPLKIGVLITTDEETTSAGIKALAAQHPLRAKIVLDNDAGSLNTIIEKYKHPVCAVIKAQGIPGHSSRPWHGINAVNKLMDCLKELQNDFPYYEKGGNRPETWCDTMTVTAFNSPQTLNVIPAEADALLNFRLTEHTSLEQLEKILFQACEKNNCTYEITLSSSGVYMDATHPDIRQYRKVAEEITGQPIEISSMCGATDSRVFAKNSVIIMHGCNGAECHGDHERAEIESIFKLAAIQREFVKRLAAKH